MNRIIKHALCWAFLILLLAAPGMAATYTYSDLYTEWPGYETPLNWEDAHGSPHLERVEVTTRGNGSLDTIKIVFNKDYGVGLWNATDFNSLFINSSWSGAEVYDNWDFYVRGNVSVSPNDVRSFSADFYQLTPSWQYTIAGDIGYRNGHPSGIDPNGAEAGFGPTTPGYLSNFAVTYGDFNNNSVVESDITYRFADLKIILGDNFVIGYTPYCANDVFLTPVPEPTTLVLLGAGLFLGICVHRRRKTS